MSDTDREPADGSSAIHHGRSPGDALAEEARFERAREALGVHPSERHALVRPTELDEPPADHQGAPTAAADIGGVGRAIGRDAGGGDIAGDVGMGDAGGTTPGDSRLGGSINGRGSGASGSMGSGGSGSMGGPGQMRDGSQMGGSGATRSSRGGNS